MVKLRKFEEADIPPLSAGYRMCGFSCNGQGINTTIR